MGTRVILAGSDSPSSMRVLREVKARNVLLSYYYIRKRKNVDWREYLKDFEWVMIDSGAHTFKSALGLSVTSSKVNESAGGQKREEVIDGTVSAGVEIKGEDRDRYIMSYLDDYAAWLQEYDDIVSTFVELDIDEIVGKEPCDGYRQYLLDKGVRRDKLMPVFHSQSSVKDTLKDFEEWAKGFQFCAVSFGDTRMSYMPLFAIARKYGVRIHGLALTSYVAIRQFPYFSVDSTSWLAGSMYGMTYVANGDRLMAYNKDKKERVRSGQRHFCEENGIDFARFMADKSKEVDLFNAHQWSLWDKKLALNTTRDYWLKERRDGKVDAEVGIAGDEGNTGAHTECAETSVIRVEAELMPDDSEPGIPSSNNLDPVEHTCIQALSTASSICLPDAKASCMACYLGDRCPQFREDGVCSLGISVRLESKADLLALVRKVIETHGERVFRQVFIEKIDGGMIDGVTTNQMRILLDMLQQMKDLFDTRDEITIKAKGQGILSQIFGIGGEKR